MCPLGFIKVGSVREPRRERVLFDGNDMTSVPIEKRNVGMVFQSYALFPNMTVADNIGYGLKIRGVRREERAVRVAELVALALFWWPGLELVGAAGLVMAPRD